MHSFPLGPVTLYGFGIVAALGFAMMWLGLNRLRGKFRLPSGMSSRVMVFAIPLGIFFGRLVYCLFRRSTVFYNPVDGAFLGLLPFFQLWKGGLSLLGVLMGVLLALFLVARLTRQPMMRLLDWAATPFALLMAFLHLGTYLAGEGYGEILENAPPFFLPYGMMNAYDEWYVAVFLIETLWYLLIALYLWLRPSHREGSLGISLLALVGSAQLFLESLHRDNYMRLEANGFIRVNQLLALLILLLAFALLLRRDGRVPGAKRYFVTDAVLLLVTAVAVIGAEFYEKLPLPTALLYGFSLVCVLLLSFVLCRHAEARFPTKNNPSLQD